MMEIEIMVKENSKLLKLVIMTSHALWVCMNIMIKIERLRFRGVAIM